MIISLAHDRAVALRDEHRELTRRKVLEAVLDLVADGSLDELSVPAVARQQRRLGRDDLPVLPHEGRAARRGGR